MLQRGRLIEHAKKEGGGKSRPDPYAARYTRLAALETVGKTPQESQDRRTHTLPGSGTAFPVVQGRSAACLQSKVYSLSLPLKTLHPLAAKTLPVPFRSAD